jgi:hypothetical protein
MEERIMKYLLQWEMRPEDMDKVIPLFKKMAELRGTKDYPKAIGPVYNFHGEMSGFTLYEVDDPKQMTNMYFHYHPLLKMSWKPIEETNNTVAAYLSRKK